MTLANDSLARVTVRTSNKVSSPHQQGSCVLGFLLMHWLAALQKVMRAAVVRSARAHAVVGDASAYTTVGQAAVAGTDQGMSQARYPQPDRHARSHVIYQPLLYASCETPPRMAAFSAVTPGVFVSSSEPLAATVLPHNACQPPPLPCLFTLYPAYAPPHADERLLECVYLASHHPLPLQHHPAQGPQARPRHTPLPRLPSGSGHQCCHWTHCAGPLVSPTGCLV